MTDTKHIKIQARIVNKKKAKRNAMLITFLFLCQIVLGVFMMFGFLAVIAFNFSPSYSEYFGIPDVGFCLLALMVCAMVISAISHISDKLLDNNTRAFLKLNKSDGKVVTETLTDNTTIISEEQKS